MKKDTIVLGLGNPLMSDEGIGVHLIHRLIRHANKYPQVDFVDAGTGGISILHLLEGRRKAVFIDCAKMGAPAGTIRRFTPDMVESTKVLSGHSLHEADLLTVIRQAHRLGQSPEEIVFFGIEPETIAPGRRLSRTLARNIPHYIRQILAEFPKP